MTLPIATVTEQKEYINKNAKELARLFQELEAQINDLPDGLERHEEELAQELEHVENDNKQSLDKLKGVQAASSIAVADCDLEKAGETIEGLMREIEGECEAPTGGREEKATIV